jgi:hypothetical protein
MRPLPLAAGLLVATARASPALAHVDFAIETRRRPIEVAAERLRGASVVGLSLYTWNERYSLTVAAHLKTLSPHTRIVVGGPSVPRKPDMLTSFLAANPTVDIAVLGEGELAFRELLESIAALPTPPSATPIAGTARLVEDHLVLGPTRERLRGDAFAATVSPYLDGTFDDYLTSDDAPPLVAAVFETNRGCPFSCSFCDWGQATESRVNELPLDRVKAELTWAANRHVAYVYFVDANFGIRRRDPDIIEHIAALKRQTGAPSFVYFHLTKNASARNLRTVELLQDAGIGSQVSLSMQDFDRDVLHAIRRDNIDPDDALTLRAQCHARGLPTTNELLLGLPRQTLTSVRKTVVAALTPFSHDSFFLYPVRLLPNAPLAHEASDLQLEVRHVPLYARDLDEPHPIPEVETLVVATPTLPIADWRQAFVFGHALAAIHDQSMLPATLPFLVWSCGVPPAAFVDALLDAFPEIRASLLRFADAILDEAASLLPLDGYGRLRWEPIDGVVAAVLDDPATFFAAVRHVLAAVVPPTHGAAAADALAFDAALFAAVSAPATAVNVNHDWSASRDARDPPHPARLRFEVAPAPTFATRSEHLSWFLAHGWARAPRRALAPPR